MKNEIELELATIYWDLQDRKGSRIRIGELGFAIDLCGFLRLILVQLGSPPLKQS